MSHALALPEVLLYCRHITLLFLHYTITFDVYYIQLLSSEGLCVRELTNPFMFPRNYTCSTGTQGVIPAQLHLYNCLPSPT